MTLELIRDSLVFSFPDVHPNAKVTIAFMRTLRIPDDNKEYPLPPGLGTFPVRHVDDFKDRIPAKWKEHGGVMIPLFQSEALWLSFQGNYVGENETYYPFAIKIATGKRSAITGDEWASELREKDYCVVPKQPWLDGFVVEGGTVRQFVAAPLGMGFSAEEQITGKAEHGGLQIEVMPMKREAFDRRFPKRERKTGGGILRSAGMKGEISESATMDYMCESFDMERGLAYAAAAPDMGLAPGGRMKQEVYEDPYDFADWDREQHGRCFVHLSNSLAWRAITKHEPPTTPYTAKHYSNYGLPWYDYYDDGKALAATETNKALKSVMIMGFQKGFGILPENEPVEFKSDQVVTLRKKGEVRDGKWA
jgi:hypothetical protein